MDRDTSSKSVASTELPLMNTIPNRKTLKKHRSELSSTFDSDFWIDISLVVLSGGLSFAALKAVECFVLTDAIVGLS